MGLVGCCGVKRGTDEQKDVEDPEKTDVFSVWRLSVSEDARGEGLGRKLMDHVEEWARLRGGKKMQLFTGNPAASKFYKSWGIRRPVRLRTRKHYDSMKRAKLSIECASSNSFLLHFAGCFKTP